MSKNDLWSHRNHLNESDLDVNVSAVRTKDRNLDITKEVLAKRWGIGTEIAARTLKVTTQHGIRNFNLSMQKRYDTRLPHLVYPLLNNKRFYTDTLISKCKLICMNQVAQVWTDGNGYCLFFPILSSHNAPSTISKMIHDL
jgi:hypothetical protein